MSTNNGQNQSSGHHESEHHGHGRGEDEFAGGGHHGDGGHHEHGTGDNGGAGGEHGHGGKPQKFEIQIDRTRYEVTLPVMTGAQLRQVPPGGIPADRDLFEVVPGEPDKKIGDDDKVQIRNGLRFFTAPGQINPGRPNR